MAKENTIPAPVRRKRKNKGHSPVRKYWWLAPALAVVAMIFYFATGPKWSRAPILTFKERPVTGNPAGAARELEPNNTPALANLMAAGKQLDGEIEASVDDVDFFRITTPPAPRDIFSIEITNRSAKLAPVLKVFDAQQVVTDLGKTMREAGGNLQQTIAPAPNTELYLQVSGYGGSAGGYTLLVRPTRAFDAYEPNDDIFHAPLVAFGSAVSAGIMDADDTDYFSFVSPRSGSVILILTNRSKTLIPALSTFYPDRRSSGFGPDVTTPGSNLRHTLAVKANETYFIQIWSQRNTAGEYSFIIQ